MRFITTMAALNVQRNGYATSSTQPVLRPAMRAFFAHLTHQHWRPFNHAASSGTCTLLRHWCLYTRVLQRRPVSRRDWYT